MEENEINQEEIEEINEIVPLNENDLAIKETSLNRSSPVLKIESGLSNFLQRSFDIAIKEQEFQDAIEEEIKKRLPTFKNQEIIALATSNKTNQNDLFSKIISPTLSLLTARQQAEMAKAKQENQTTVSQTNIQEINTMAPQEVLVGLKSLFDMANVLKKADDVVDYEKI